MMVREGFSADPIHAAQSAAAQETAPAGDEPEEDGGITLQL